MNFHAENSVFQFLWRILGAQIFIIILPLFITKMFNSWKNRNKLFGKVVLITGASSGIGEALSHALYRRGCKLILASRRLEELERVKSDLMAIEMINESFSPEILPLDLADLSSIPKFVENALKFHKRIDILVNNAGISFRGDVLETSLEVDMKLMSVNYFGQVYLTKAVLPSMIENKSGCIAMINSVQGKLGLAHRSAYGASKHALLGFTDSLRCEVDKYGITVLSVLPGYVKTNLSLNAITASGETYGRMDNATSSGYRPEKLAKDIVSALMNDSTEVTISPWQAKLAIQLRTMAPSLIFPILRRMGEKNQ